MLREVGLNKMENISTTLRRSGRPEGGLEVLGDIRHYEIGPLFGDLQSKTCS